MRIIAGNWRGRKLTAPPGRGTRPMLDRVRESLFNVLGPRLAQARVWDLFAGSGSLGLEALSRGADQAWFVENNRNALKILRANLAQCQGEGEEGPGLVITGDGWDPALPPDNRPDLIFLDPPYPQVTGNPEMVRVGVTKLLGRLSPGGMIAFHYPAKVPLAAGALAGFDAVERIWGTSAIALLEHPDQEEEEPE